jgi:hypothetical protein
MAGQPKKLAPCVFGCRDPQDPKKRLMLGVAERRVHEAKCPRRATGRKGKA